MPQARKARLDRKPAADKAWMTPNESQAATISVICKAILGGKPFDGLETDGEKAISVGVNSRGSRPK